MNTLVTLAVAILTLAACAGCGRLAGRLWRGKSDSLFERLLIDTALGGGVLSLVFFVLGTLQLYRLPVLIAALVIPAAALAILTVNDARHRDGGLKSGEPASGMNIPDDQTRSRVPSGLSTLDSRLSTLILIALALSTLIPALAPPAMSDWDSLAYHLAVPKLYVQHGGIYHIGIMSHSNFPMLMEMLYLPAVALNLPEAARVLNWMFGVLLVGAVWLMAHRSFGRGAGRTAALGIAGMPIVLFLATTAYIDLATALYTMVSVYLLLSYLRTSERGCLIGSAIAAGFAASTKMTGLVTIALIVIWLLAERRVEWKRALMFAGIAVAACAPWYVKTFIYTGSPVYPFFHGLLGGRGWTAEMAALYSQSQAHFGMGHDLPALLMLPWNLAMHSERFYDTPGLFVGPIFLIAIPILFLARYKSRELIGLLGFFVAYVLIWFGLSHQSRYLIPAFAILAVLVSGLVYSDERLANARRALTLVFTLTAVFGILTLWPAIKSSAPVVFGRESRDDYLARSLDVYRADQFANANLPANARIALMGDTRGYYLNRAYTWADWGHNAEFSRKYSSADDFVSYLKSRGITHVMINFGFFPPRGKGADWLYDAADNGLLARVYPHDGERGRVEIHAVE